MAVNEFETEPVPGLPERLPEGEYVVWQGSPNGWALARSVFHIRALVAYFLIIAAWPIAKSFLVDMDLRDAVGSTLLALLLGGAAIGGLVLLARLIARGTLYTVTNRRLVFRFGIALPMSINIPFSTVAEASLRVNGDGTGNIPLRLSDERIGYCLLWPHVRPWRFRRPEPMLRAVPDAVPLAESLANALAASMQPDRADVDAAEDGDEFATPLECFSAAR